MLLIEKRPFFQLFFFQEIQARKMCFTILQNVKPSFQAIKTRSSKSRKIEIFPKGLTHGFDPKLAIFPTFIFWQYKPKKCALRYSRTKKTFFQAKKTTRSKSKKNQIIPKELTHGFSPKKAIFPTLFFFGNISQEHVFNDILERKTVFLGYKNTKFKKSKN